MNQLAKKTATGAVINISVIFTKNIGQFLIVFPILARILTPEEFGLIAMAMTLVAFLTMFNDLGISAALVRAETASSAFWSSAFWLNLGFGAAMAITSYLSAPLVAALFGEPQVIVLIEVMSCMLLLHCSFLVPMAWLQRNYKFRTIAVIDLVAILSSSAVAIYMAVAGYGVWALAWQQIVLYAVKAVMGLLAHKAPIRLTFEWAPIKAVLPFSLSLTGTGFVSFLNRNIDNVLIGRYLGADALGYYSRAYQLMMMPVSTLSGGLSFAMYPAMAEVQSDTSQLRAAYLKAVSLLSAIVLPAMTGIAIVAVPFVDLLFGSQWGPVAPLLMVLAFVGLIQSVIAAANDLWKARGRSGVLLRWSIIRAFGFAIAFSIGIYIGNLQAMATAYLIANLIFLVPFQFEVFKELEMSAAIWLQELLPQFVSTLIMAGGLLLVKASFPEIQTLASPVQLLVLVPIGMAAYGLALLAFFRSFLRTIVSDVRALRSKNATA